MRMLFLSAILLSALGSAAQGPKVPFITPYPGSTLGAPVRISEYAEYDVLVGPMKANASVEKAGGRLTRIFLRGPKERSLLEIFTNYEEALRRDGFTMLFRCAKKDCGGGKTKDMETSFNPAVEQYFLSARKYSPAGAVYATVLVNDHHNPATRVDVIEVRPMQTGLVKVTADQMAKDIAATGRVALYSILFDTGKADIKPESEATLGEIARLLASNAALKIYVAGHTDNVGTYESNLDLSRRRAESVVKALTSKHGIAAGRLRAVGVASVSPVASNRSEDGRRLNRRVELVEQ